MKKELTSERLRELLSYDQETGVFAWKVKRRVTQKQGTCVANHLRTDINEFRLKDVATQHIGLHGCMSRVSGQRETLTTSMEYATTTDL